MKSITFALPSLLLLACSASSLDDDVVLSRPTPASVAPESVADFVSGARLRARYYDTGSGLRRFAGWVDTATGADCAYPRSSVSGESAVATDGLVRCLPRPTVGLQGYAWVYTDGACSSRALVRSDTTSRYVVAIAPDTLANRRDVREIATVYEMGAAIVDAVWASSNGACVPKAVPAGSEVRAVSPVMPGAFVAAEDEDSPRGPRLAARYHVGEDGSRELYSVLDRQRGETCDDKSQGGAPGTHCFPTQPALAEVFADPSCQTPAALREGAGYGAPPRSAVVFGADEYYEIGAPLPSSYYRHPTSLECTTAAFAGPMVTMWSLGAPIPVESFAAVSVQRGGATGLTVPSLIAEDGTRVAPSTAFGPFVDTSTGASCAPVAADDKIYCVPINLDTPGDVTRFPVLVTGTE